MPGTLNPTCPLCGLRYTDRPLLELHIREDHLHQGGHAEPDHDDSGGATAAQPRVRGAFPPHGLGSELPSTTDEVMTTTATRRPRRSRSGGAMTALRRAIRALRYVNEELTLAGEAIARSARASQTHPGGGARKEDARTASTAERADRGRLTRWQSAVQLSAPYPRTAQRPDTAERIPPTARPRDQDERRPCAQTR
jgi:hypothetical protein